MTLAPGSRLGPYEISQSIGAGGMGEVYRARHLKLGRDVAVKVLPDTLAHDPDRLARLEREARTASALNHPNIVTIHDIAEHEGTTYVVMELVDGRTLRELLGDGALSVDRALDIARQIADGLATAHAAGVVHRDVKPDNVMVTPDGLVKILDFGLARPLPTSGDRDADVSVLTRDTAAILGTPNYMSPEQLSNEGLDDRSDQFAFGVLVYELVAGRPPFEGSSVAAVMGAIVSQSARPLTEERPGAPAELDRIVRRCLEKEAADRFPSMKEVGAALSRLDERRKRTERTLATLKRPTVAGPLVVLVLALGAWSGLWWLGAERRWAEDEAMPEIAGFIETGDLYRAYRTALLAESHRPDDPELDRVFDRVTLPVAVNTVPPGARVLLREYGAEDAEWISVGETPLELRVPYELTHWRIERDGYEPFEGAPFGGGSFQILAAGLVLDSVGRRPPGTVRVPGGRLPPVPLMGLDHSVAGTPIAHYYLGRHEVTNRDFAAFVDAGGYETREWWPPPMAAEEREGAWEDAMDRFRDPTGRPGPSTWELGEYPEDQGDHPVSGISWFEAWAYCAFAGRSLPTIFHWFGAIGQEQRSDILAYSNVNGTGKARVGRFQGISAYGAYDMAGNVKEWVWNASDDGGRYILGASWNEPGYLFKHLIAQDPWGREATNGVRCVEYEEPPSGTLTGPVMPLRENPAPEPVSDEAFELLRGLYAYDRDPLEARVERAGDSVASYRRETVSIRTAYGRERMVVNLLIPHDGDPPYQSVLWYPGDDVFALRSSEGFASEWLFDFLPRSGRVVVYPVYRGMYERFEAWQRTPNDWRDMMISWAQDLGRTIDYLETREDFDAGAIAYYGFSGGAAYAPVFMAVEPRIRTAIIIGGGQFPRPVHPAMDPAHFAPRTRTPVLMINGENDFLMPYEEAQRPFFQRFGAPDSLKRHARLPGGHIPEDTRDVMREVLDWLDRHLGPVE